MERLNPLDAQFVDAEDGDRIARLIDDWAAGHGLPFIPVQVDPWSYALVPPAG